MTRRERNAVVGGRIDLRLRIIAECQVECWAVPDLATRSLDGRIPPSSTPALLDGGRQGRRIHRGHATPKQGAEHTMDEAARAAIN